MAIHGEVKINGVAVARWHAQRVFTDPTGNHTYRWEVVGVAGRKAAGDLRHQYGDGAVALAQKILAAAEAQWALVGGVADGGQG